ncbi:MAG: FemAB family PEP-CTERM system-associated protein [Acidobacteria bacterium]|nr:FemAB family PEP-CTERM system-associated protein [Acidobacteriota bacterium]
MAIIRCDDAHRSRWNAFTLGSPRASFYHRWEWREINERCFGHATTYLAAVDDGRLVGILPLVRLKSLLFGNLACSMPFVNYGGPAGESDDVEEQLLQAAGEVADEWGVEYVELRSRRRLPDRYPYSDHKVSMTIALDPDPEVVLGRMKREQRAEIRRAYKHGFVARFGADQVDEFYRILSESWREMGTPIYRIDYLKAILAAFPDATRLCVVYDADGRPAAGAFDGLHNGTWEGMWLGIRSEYRRQLAGYVLYWELIRHACESGAQLFHLGRSSKDSGGDQFKKKWNAEALQLYWTYLLRTRREMPTLNPTNPKYQLAIKAWRRLPLAMTQVMGPFLARSIP